MKRLGQHFLKNRSALEKIANALELSDGEFVIEIGPGHGELTELLAQKNTSVLAIEKDKILSDPLRKHFESAGKNVEVLEGDALKILEASIKAFSKKSSGGSYKLAGNIPYYITGKLLRIISDLEPKPERTVLLIQREVAERICATPPKMNRLSASVQFWAEPKILGSVPRTDFSPPPEVDSAIILLKTKSSTLKQTSDEADRYYAAVRTLFAQPRKTILNNLSAANAIKEAKTSKEEITRLLAEIPVAATDRPQDLSVPAIAGIAEIFF